MGRARGRARRPTRGRGKRDGRSLAGPEKSAHIGNVIPYATRRRPATPGRDGAVVVWRRIFPEGGSMPRASLVSPPVVPLLSRSRTTTMNNVRIPTMRASTASNLFGAAAVALLCARSEERRVGKECRSGGWPEREIEEAVHAENVALVM